MNGILFSDLKNKIEVINGIHYFNCFEIACYGCIFNSINNVEDSNKDSFENSCKGKISDYDFHKLKEANIPDNTVITIELIKDFKK